VTPRCWISGWSESASSSVPTLGGEDPGRGMEAYERRGTDRTWHVIDAVQKVAEDRGVSMAEVALAWVTAFDYPNGELGVDQRSRSLLDS
jgi:hypothetical protein